ncbi:MAG: T9SS type A sorting domain-containing protein [Saprospiraceae bacterium]
MMQHSIRIMQNIQKIVLALALILVLQPAMAQTYNGSLILTTQASVDAFNFTEVTGSLTIRGTNITNVNGLSGLTNIGNYLNIYDNPALISIAGLENLSSVAGRLNILNNPSLTSVSGLGNLSYVGSIWIYDNPSLAAITGLGNLSSVGSDVDIHNNSSLISIAGLGNLSSVGSIYLYSLPSLSSLSGLENLSSVTGSNGGNFFSPGFILGDLPSLTSLQELESLSSVTGYFGISLMTSLTSLSGLENLGTGVSHLVIAYNPSLTDCCAIQGLLETGTVSTVEIYNNQTGCDSETAVLEAICVADSDGDGVYDDVDNCLETANPDQADEDGDGIGDTCDACPVIPDPNCATCGNGKYLVCHIPPGQPENAQQLCISINAANNHIGNHGGCYWGYCNAGLVANESNPHTKAASHPKRGYDHTQGNNTLVETAKGNVYFFEISPNPATDKINLHLHGHSADALLYIYDQLGRRVWMQQLEEAQSSLQLNLNLDNGIYFVSLISNGETISKQLVISK